MRSSMMMDALVRIITKEMAHFCADFASSPSQPHPNSRSDIVILQLNDNATVKQYHSNVERIIFPKLETCVIDFNEKIQCY